MEDIKIGKVYSCKAVGLTENIVGIVEHLYINTAVVNVLDYLPCDHDAVNELQGRVVAKLSNIVEMEASQAV